MLSKSSEKRSGGGTLKTKRTVPEFLEATGSNNHAYANPSVKKGTLASVRQAYGMMEDNSAIVGKRGYRTKRV